MHFVSIVAHPIDETKCVGGTLVRAVRTGHHGTNVVCVHPNGRGEWPIPESVPDSELAEYIAEEGRRAARILGIDIEFLHLDEPTLVAPERRAQNARAIAA